MTAKVELAGGEASAGSRPGSPSTMSGKGTLSAKIATNEAPAIATASLLRAREPMRWAACSTMAVTAGLMP